MKKSDAISTQTELAKALDVIQSNVSRMIRRPDWKWGKGPWKRSQIPAIQRWRANTLKVGKPEKAGTSPADIRMADLRYTEKQARVREINAKAEAAETALAREKGKLISVADVSDGMKRIAHRMRNDLQNLAASIVPDALIRGMPQTAAAEFQAVAEAKILGVMRAMSEAGRKDYDAEAD